LSIENLLKCCSIKHLFYNIDHQKNDRNKKIYWSAFSSAAVLPGGGYLYCIIPGGFLLSTANDFA
jgi:hypothetical protein